MSSLRDLYQELILEHARHPRNFRDMGEGSRHAEGYNPLCGDHFAVWLVVDGGVIKDASFKGAGCAISTASASVMTEALKGRSEKDAEALFDTFLGVVTGATPAMDAEALGKLGVFAGVAVYPSRVKCASLAWHAMKAALADQRTMITTE